MNDKEIMHYLLDARHIVASDKLHDDIGVMTRDLAVVRQGFYFPLFALQAAMASIVLIVLVSIGSGVVVAAKGTHPGSPFYPVKQALHAIAPAVVPADVTPTLTQSAPTPIPVIHQEEKQEKKEQRRHILLQNDDEEKDVKGIQIHRKSREEENENKQSLYIDGPVRFE